MTSSSALVSSLAFLAEYGLVLLGSLTTVGAIASTTAYATGRIVRLESALEVERSKGESALEVERSKRESAVAQAELRTAHNFLRLGFTEEYVRYQARVGLRDQQLSSNPQDES